MKDCVCVWERWLHADLTPASVDLGAEPNNSDTAQSGRAAVLQSPEPQHTEETEHKAQPEPDITPHLALRSCDMLYSAAVWPMSILNNFQCLLAAEAHTRSVCMLQFYPYLARLQCRRLCWKSSSKTQLFMVVFQLILILPWPAGDLLDLLKWRTHSDRIMECLTKLKDIDGTEIVKVEFFIRCEKHTHTFRRGWVFFIVNLMLEFNLILVFFKGIIA